jgi:hypothetical protein
MKSEDENIPVFGSWKRWYALVLIVALVQFIAYYILTQSY